jgi:hypothetical protein
VTATDRRSLRYSMRIGSGSIEWSIFASIPA